MSFMTHIEGVPDSETAKPGMVFFVERVPTPKPAATANTAATTAKAALASGMQTFNRSSIAAIACKNAKFSGE